MVWVLVSVVLVSVVLVLGSVAGLVLALIAG
jgi:hypothetical protein